MKARFYVVGAVFLLAIAAYAQQQSVMLGSENGTGAIRRLNVDSTGAVKTIAVATSGRCANTSPHAVTSVGVASTSVPAAAATSRQAIRVCNSVENAGTPIVKCRSDNTAPVMGGTTPGEVLNVGDCVTYDLTAAQAMKCISSGAATAVTSYECVVL